MIAGIPADLTWSHSARQLSGGDPRWAEQTPMSTPKTLWLPALAALLGLFQILAGAEMMLSDAGVEPIRRELVLTR